MSDSRPIYEALRAALLASRPVALATVVGVEREPDAGAGSADAARVPNGDRVDVEPDGLGPPVTLGAKLLVREAAEAGGGRDGDSRGDEGGAGAAAGSDPAADAGFLPELGTLGNPELDRVVVRDARAALDRGATVTRHYGPRGEARQNDVAVFIESFARPPRLVIFGAVDFTAALAAAGKLLGFYVTVCDARPVFATPRRFPAADEVVVDWPDRFLAKIGSELGPRDAICILTHDTKFDVPAVLGALATRAGYLGAMGSRRTHEERRRRLLEAGADEAELDARLMSPIGLDIGARTPEETAVSICAEIVANHGGITVPSLRDGAGPIHRR